MRIKAYFSVDVRFHSDFFGKGSIYILHSGSFQVNYIFAYYLLVEKKYFQEDDYNTNMTLI